MNIEKLILNLLDSLIDGHNNYPEEIQRCAASALNGWKFCDSDFRLEFKGQRAGRTVRLHSFGEGADMNQAADEVISLMDALIALEA